MENVFLNKCPTLFVIKCVYVFTIHRYAVCLLEKSEYTKPFSSFKQLAKGDTPYDSINGCNGEKSGGCLNERGFPKHVIGLFCLVNRLRCRNQLQHEMKAFKGWETFHAWTVIHPSCWINCSFGGSHLCFGLDRYIRWRHWLFYLKSAWVWKPVAGQSGTHHG